MTRWAVRRLGIVIGLFGWGCGARHLAPPPSAPSLARPLDAMPADLDLVVRLDLHRIKDTLGAPAMDSLMEQAVKGLHGADQATDALLLHALGETDTLWLGTRPSAALDATDTVLVMSGHFSNFDPHGAASTPPFAPPLELGGDFKRFDRASPKARAAPARIYTRGDDLVVSLSEAEEDSVERSLEARLGAPPLDPAEQGVLAAVVRPRLLPEELFSAAPALRKLAERALRCELNADLTSAGVDARLALKFEDPNSAERVGGALTDLRDALQNTPGRLAKLAARVQISNAAEYVTLRLAIGRDELSELVNCRGTACAW